MQDIISMRDFSKEEIIAVLDAAEEVKKAIHHQFSYGNEFKNKHGRDVRSLLKGLKIAALFLENSTRTNFSFRAAAGTAGGFVDGFPTQAHTSLKKGETWADTAGMFAGYGYDALVIRSTEEGLPRWTKEFLEENYKQIKAQHQKFNLPFNYKVPLIINGGDGKNQHPTQCFLDLFTMREIARAHGKELEGLNISLLNDLKHGRTNASLMSVAHLFNFKLHFAYPNRFGPDESVLENLKRRNVETHDYHNNFPAAMKASFIAYHSRPQKERVGKGEYLESIKKIGQITKIMYDQMGGKAPFLMHPLPVDAETFAEISHDMRDHPKNVTKLQSSNGLYVRIALLALGLGRMQTNYPLSEKKELQDMTIKEIPVSSEKKKLENPRSGYIEGDGVVLDHIPLGIGRRLAGVLGFENKNLPKVISDFMSRYKDKEPIKDMIKLYCAYDFSQEQLQAIGLLAPSTTISIVKDCLAVKKFEVSLGNYIKGRVKCSNPACITNVKKENLPPKHYVEKTNEETLLICQYCEKTDTVKQAYEENRFIYIGD